jgi:hypothetical protein
MKDRNKSSRPQADDDDREPDAFAERIGDAMRAPERLDLTFEARVMSAVHAEARAGHAPRTRRPGPFTEYWLSPRIVRVSRLRSLALGVVVAGLTVMASQTIGLLYARFSGSASLPTAARDTVHIVRFVLVDAQAQSVSLVGDFNAWNKDATRLTALGHDGVWTVSLPLRSGRHEYAFIVEGTQGEHWMADPFAAVVRDEFDTESSVILVGNPSAHAAGRGSS